MGAPQLRRLEFLAALGNQAAFEQLLIGVEDQILLDGLLRVAAEAGHANIVELLIRRGADPYSADARGMTAIGLACAGGHVSAVRLLLREGADFRDLSSHGGSCVAWFVETMIDDHRQLSAVVGRLATAAEEARQEKDRLLAVIAAQQAEIDLLRAPLGQRQGSGVR